MCRWCAGCTTLNKILQFTTRLNCGFNHRQKFLPMVEDC
jgi:hypothetical protein